MHVPGLSPWAGKPNRSFRAKFLPVYIPSIDVLHTHTRLCSCCTLGRSESKNTNTAGYTRAAKASPLTHPSQSNQRV